VNLSATDKTILKIIKAEEKRQKTTLQMIPSENFTSKAVMEAVGSVLMNKYTEGYAGKRYYQGAKLYDDIEKLAIERAKKVFGVEYVNVQPYSGSPANMAVYFTLLEKQDKVLGLSLPFGGHLTHGHPEVTFLGRYFNTIQYRTDAQGFLDYTEIERLALEHKPKIIISGATAYPRLIDFEKIGKIADMIGAFHMADISHIAGLVAANVHPSPVDFAHIVTSTTHKTLRGPRGAMIMITKKGIDKDSDLPSKIDKAVFPGLQGGPHNNTTAGIAVALLEAQSQEFKKYAKQIVLNAQALSNTLKAFGFKLLTDGTDNHLILIDLSNKGVDGWCTAWALEFAGIIVNRNSVPFDKNSAFYPSGIRLGTPALTTQGLKETHMKVIAELINRTVEACIPYLGQAELDNATRKNFKMKISKDKSIKAVAKEVSGLLKTLVP
jgi:glycine hydroxymethyltransferase